MTPTDFGHAAYLVLLLVAVGGWFVVENRASLGRSLRMAVAWALIFVGVIAVIGLWDDIRSTVRPSLGRISETGRIEVPRARDGHYYLTLAINEVPVEFLVDTGASQMVLTDHDARRAGLDTGTLVYSGRAMTANGPVRTAPVDLDRVRLGPIEDRRLRAWVNSGEMEQSLLGMSYLQRWSKIEITGGALVLTR